ncbi:ABC transporter substrate-binding protein [Thermotoga sp. KOL6]|uniref:ABC transporter substrate-binding protein n=1 Tax=Thermotoga sp. KOL6 TaxID=126741 RepID=UPI000C7837EF|nr:ABC transporter substrate-binding protein [Thermotoga sp. KOL6]PLV59043.1 hypothetical protein AS005_04605 [Thermotoga sp. KOL6]
MKKFLVLALVLVFAMGSLLMGYNTPQQVSKMKIFFIVKASESEFWQIVLDGARKAAKHYGVELIDQAPTSEADVAKQVSILETAISMKPDAIVLAPTVADALVPGIEKATAMGIPVIIIDSAANTDKYVTFLASDNYKIGQLAADELAKAMIKKFGEAKGKVAAFTFMSGVGSLEARMKGFLDRVKEKYPGIEIVTVRDAMGKQGNTLNMAIDVLTAYPDLRGIFANNQYTGDEVVRALDMRGVKNLAFVAVDAGPQELWGLENGYVDALILQKPWVMGYSGVAFAVLARNLTALGFEFPKFIDTGIVAITPDMLGKPEAEAILDPVNFYKNW